MRSLALVSLLALGAMALWSLSSPVQADPPACDQISTDCLQTSCGPVGFINVPAGGCLIGVTPRWKEKCERKFPHEGIRNAFTSGWRDAAQRPLCPLVDDNIMTSNCSDRKLADTQNGPCDVIYDGCGGNMAEQC